jgi:hypothetical protein
MRRWQLGLLAGANTIISVSLSVISNAASDALPKALEEHPGWSWTLVGIFALAAVACAVPLVLGSTSPQKHGSLTWRNSGVYAGRDLKISGKGHRVAGGHIIDADVPANPSSTTPPEVGSH